ncbi:hypothetical protein [Streptomyces sp. A0592]|uniref:hypothetical protein n=1 Tax=Streptomyces sp. A0592 TaxID=2563099 RepID=UPI0014458904|nr:hypothetical protein [Streptomyces sp. A0592]
MKTLADDEGGDDTSGAVGADLVMDLADDLADVDKKQAFLARSEVVRDVCGDEVDRPVREEPTAQTAGNADSARVFGAGLPGRRSKGCGG